MNDTQPTVEYAYLIEPNPDLVSSVLPLFLDANGTLKPIRIEPGHMVMVPGRVYVATIVDGVVVNIA